METWEEFRANIKPEIVQVITEWKDEGGSIRDLSEYITAWIYASKYGSAGINIKLDDWPEEY